MTQMRLARQMILLLLACLVFGGCIPQMTSSSDPQKDPYFQIGKSRMQSLDYQGAIEAFEKALENNPQSAPAHKELGLLCYQRTRDYAAAIYHFERLLKLRPNDEHADTFRQFINYCKQELAREVSLAPVSQKMQQDLERLDQLARENMQLRQQITNLHNHLAEKAAIAASLQRSAPETVTPLPPTAPPPQIFRPPDHEAPFPPAGASPAASSPRTHTVRSGDTLYSISRNYNVKEEAIRAANPGLDPRRLQIGQTIRIPQR